MWLLIFQKAAQFACACRVFQFLQRLLFNLANAFTGDADVFANLFQGAGFVGAHTETLTQNSFFLGVQLRQNLRDDFAQVFLGGRYKRIFRRFVRDDFNAAAVVLGSDGGLE